MRTVTAAASSALVSLVAGAPRRVEVVVTLPVAVHLAVGGPVGGLLSAEPAGGPPPSAGPAGGPPSVCLALPGAVRLPSALLVRAGWGSLPVGAAGTIGAGGLELPGLSVRVARWWRVPRPTLHWRGGVPGAPALDRVTARLVKQLSVALASPLWITRGNARLVEGRGVHFPEYSSVDGSVDALLGRGPGLTPLGDDVLAGALVTLRAVGAQHAADALADAVLARASATTFVSAALLWHAARGECVPELAALFRALDTGLGLDAARAAVLQLGHTSGAGLLHGVAAALRATDEREECA